MKRQASLAVVVVFVLPALVVAQGADSVSVSRDNRPQFRDYALESAGALGCGCAVSVVPLVVAEGLLISATLAGSSWSSGTAVGCVGLGAYAAGSAFEANRIGNRRGWSGSFGWSLGLAAVPAACGVLYFTTGLSYAGIAGAFLAVVGTPVMAAVGYNIKSTNREPRSWEHRISPPSFAARTKASPNVGALVCLDARLVSIRF